MFIGVLLVVPRKPAKTKKVETTWKKKRKGGREKRLGKLWCMYVHIYIFRYYATTKKVGVKSL